MYHRGPPMIHSHSCSTFIKYTSPPRREHCKHRLPSFVCRQYERGPEHRSFSERFYGAIPRKASHGNFPVNTKRMVTPGTTRTSLSLSPSLTGRVPADLRSQTSQIVRGLVISRWTAPMTLVVSLACDSFRQSTSHSFAADVSINAIDSMQLSPAPRRSPSRSP